jgi:hypothetical protein
MEKIFASKACPAQSAAAGGECGVAGLKHICLKAVVLWDNLSA